MANHRKSGGIKVLIYNRDGNEYLCDSIREASEFIGVSHSTVVSRCRDGYAIQVGDGHAVRVRWG